MKQHVDEKYLAIILDNDIIIRLPRCVQTAKRHQSPSNGINDSRVKRNELFTVDLHDGALVDVQPVTKYHDLRLIAICKSPFRKVYTHGIVDLICEVCTSAKVRNFLIIYVSINTNHSLI